jgi:hypothetical protein
LETKYKPKNGEWETWNCWTLDEEEIVSAVEELGFDIEKNNIDTRMIAHKFTNALGNVLHDWNDILKDCIKEVVQNT